MLGNRLAEQAEVGRARRDDRYHLREWLWRRSTVKRVRGCGRKRIAAEVGIVVNEGRAHVSGVQSCGSIHSCPVCSAKIRNHRALEFESAGAQHLAAGGEILFGTLTLRHHSGQALQPMFDAVLKSWRACLSGRQWQEMKHSAGIVGVVRAVEVVHGANGWHPHIHYALLLSRPSSEAMRAELFEHFFSTWSTKAVKLGMGRPGSAGQDLRVVNSVSDLSQYILKAFAFELSRTDMKKGKGGSRSWVELLSDARDGCVESAELFREYERATRGRQAVTWSKGLRARFAVAEVEDQALAEAEVGGELVACLDGPTWKAVCSRFGGLVLVLRAAESRGQAGVSEAVRHLASLPPSR